MFNVVFGDEFLSAIEIDKRRVGRPRNKWIEMTMAEAWKRFRADSSEQYVASLDQRMAIKAAAENRDPPFRTKGKKK